MTTTGIPNQTAVRGDEADTHLQNDRDLARFHDLVGSVNAILWEADPRTWQFTYVSPHAERLLGYPCAQWLAEPDFWKAHLHPADRDWAAQLCATAVNEGRDHALEYRFIASNGHFRWLRDEVRVIHGEHGVEQLRGVMVDVTEEHRAEERSQRLAVERTAREAAEQAHRRFVELVSGLNAIVWEADPADWRFTFVSDGIERILGIPAARWIGEVECLPAALHEDDRAGWLELRRACEEGGGGSELTCRVTGADGRTVWLHTVVRTVPDGAGGVRRYRGLMVDVTRQMEAERERERLRRRIEEQSLFIDAALQQIPVGLVVLGADGAERVRSGMADRIAGDPTDLGRRAMAQREVLMGEELVVDGADGERIHVRVNAAPVLNPDDRVMGAVVTAEDISGTRHLEAELRAREERLRLVTSLVPVQVWTAQPDGRLDFVNTRVLEYFGRSPESLLRECWRRDIHPDDRARVRDQVSRSLSNGEEFRAEVRLRRSNGTYRWHISQALPQFDEDGRIVRWFGTNMDVDEQRRAEQALRERQQREHFLAEAGRVLVGTLDCRAALEEVAALALPLLGDFCSVDLLGPDDTVDCVAWRHVSPTAAAWHAEVQSSMTADAGGHVVGLLAEREGALHVADSAADSAWLGDRLRFLRPLAVASLIAVPLRVQGAMAGALTFGVTESERRFTEADVMLASSLADRASLALANARMLESARDARERLQAALDASGTGTFRWDIPADAIEWDDGLERLFGFRGAAGTRTTEQILALVHEDDRPRVGEAIRRCREEGAPFEEEFRTVWPDGSVHWIVNRGRTYTGAEGRPAYVTGACVDVTDRRRREDQFRALAESIPQLVWIADRTGSIFWYNRRWSEYTGLSPDALQRMGWQQVHHADHVQRVTTGIRHSFDTGEPWEDVFPLRGAAGTWRWFLSRARPVHGAKGDVELWFGTSTDITELREAELARDRALEEARRDREQAERANETKTEFLATLSHDLRTPLNAVNGYASLMLEELFGPVTAGQVDALGRVKRANEHLLALVEDILHFAKVEAGNIELEPEALDVGAVLAALQPMIAPQMSAKGLVWECSTAMDGVRVRADRERLTQILVNLLANAVKFTDSGKVRLEADAVDSRVRIRVSDTGPGIPEADAAAIFEPYVQIGSMKSAREGFGLGLAISRQLARAMDGDLTVESEPGNGSTFTLVLPMA
jgi:PAS domain S-box-containing protein